MDNFLIKKETLENTANSFRLYLTPLGNETHRIREEFIDDTELIDVEVYYWEDCDADGRSEQRGRYWSPSEFDGGLGTYGYLEDDEGRIVPIIRTWSMVSNAEEVGRDDKYYYVGIDKIGSEIYDKWRKIELTNGDGDEPDSDNYTWDNGIQNYIYTNRIVESVKKEEQLISPESFPQKIDEVYMQGMVARKY